MGSRLQVAITQFSILASLGNKLNFISQRFRDSQKNNKIPLWMTLTNSKIKEVIVKIKLESDDYIFRILTKDKTENTKRFQFEEFKLKCKL